jgi:methyl-accepting chemotaxis protein PixJ
VTIGTIVTAVLVSAIAALIANRATRPILDAAGAVDKIGQGELDTRLEVQGEDELAHWERTSTRWRVS